MILQASLIEAMPFLYALGRENLRTQRRKAVFCLGTGERCDKHLLLRFNDPDVLFHPAALVWGKRQGSGSIGAIDEMQDVAAVLHGPRGAFYMIHVFSITDVQKRIS